MRDGVWSRVELRKRGKFEWYNGAYRFSPWLNIETLEKKVEKNKAQTWQKSVAFIVGKPFLYFPDGGKSADFFYFNGLSFRAGERAETIILQRDP